MVKVSWYSLGADIALGNLKDYLHEVETYLEKAQKNFETWADAEAAKLSPSVREEFYEHLSDEHWQYGEVFPRILRNSFLVTMHSVLEHELAGICKLLQRGKNIPIPWTELRGGITERANVYISKLGGLDFPTGQSWAEINSYIAIRNCIVHTAGNVHGLSKEKEKRLRNYCSKQGGISIDKDGNLVLSKDFCLQAVSTLQEFFEELYDSYEGKKSAMTYHVYQNWTVHKAKVHFSDCSFCNNAKGIHPDAGPNNGRWLGPFATLYEALQVAQATGEPVSKCRFCRP